MSPVNPAEPPSPSLADFTINVIRDEDRDEVLAFLRCFFFRDEPLNASIGLLDGDHPTCHALEDYCMKQANNGYCLKAISGGKIIGLALNEILERAVHNPALELPPYADNAKFDKIIQLLEYVSKDCNLFSHFPDMEKAFTVKILSVDGSCRGRGIGKELMDHSREIGRKAGCKLMTVDCTSHFTARALEKLKFECLYKLNYSDYKVDGQVVFKPAAPHKALTVYVQRI